MTDRAGARLQVKNLRFSRNEQVLFDGLDFEVSSGEILQIEGANGSGKTTLLRVLCALMPYHQGDVLWNGENIRNNFPEYASSLAYVGHAPGVKDELTPLENLEMAYSLGRCRDGADAQQVLGRVGIPPEHEDIPCRKLSAGQRRRVALGRLLIGDAQLWVLDEPFTALDRSGRRLIEELLIEHVKNDGMVVLTTHHSMSLGDCKVQALHLGT